MNEDKILAFGTGDMEVHVYTRADWDAKEAEREREFRERRAAERAADIAAVMGDEEFELQPVTWDEVYTNDSDGWVTFVGWTPTRVICAKWNDDRVYMDLFGVPRNP